MAFRSDVSSTGGYKPKKTQGLYHKNPPFKGVKAPKRPVTSKAPKHYARTPASQPVSEHAMASKNRTYRINASRRRQRYSQRGAKDWAARTSTFIPWGIHAQAKANYKKLSQGERFALDVLRNGRVPVVHLPGQPPTGGATTGPRILATRKERQQLASARSAKNFRLGIAADLRPLHVGEKYQPKNTYAAVPKPYSEANSVLSVGGLPGDRAIAKAKQQNDIKLAKKKISYSEWSATNQALETKHQEAYKGAMRSGLVETGGNAKPHGFMRWIGEYTKAMLATPFAMTHLIAHPEDATKIPGAIAHDFTHFTDNPLFAFTDVAGLAAGGLGGAGRVGTALTRLATGKGLKAAGRGLLDRPFVKINPDTGRPFNYHTITHKGTSATVPVSRNPFINIYRRANPEVGRVVDRFVSPDTPILGRATGSKKIARAIEQNMRADRGLRHGEAAYIYKKGQKLTTPEQLAVHLVEREQIHPMDYAEAYRNEANAITSKTRKAKLRKARLLNLADQFEAASQYIKVRGRRIYLTGKPAELADYISRGLAGREETLIKHGFLDKKTIEDRALKPRQEIERMLGRAPRKYGKPKYAPHGIDLEGGLTGFFRSVSGKIGTSKAIPASIRKPLAFGVMRSGLMTSKGTRLITQRMVEAHKIEDWAITYDELRKSGITPSELQKRLDRGESIDNYTVIMPKSALKARDKKELATFMEQGKSADAITKAYQNLVKDARHEHLSKRGVRFVDKNIAESLSPEIRLGSKSSKFVSSVDVINHGVVGAMLFLGSKYVVTNLPGQAWLALTSGALNPINLASAVKLQHEMSDNRVLATGFIKGKGKAAQTKIKIREATGEGISRSISTRPGHIFAKTANVYSKIIDDPFRWLTFVYHARRAGYATAERIQHLIESDGAHEIATRRSIIQDTNRDMIDYGRMNHTEREIVRRLLIFYPWIKGSTLYGGRWMREHPLQAAIQINQGKEAIRKRTKILGPVPDFMQSVIPLKDLENSWIGNLTGVKGTQNIPGLGKVQRIIDPTAASIITQPAQIAQDIQDTIGLRPKFGSYIGPIASLATAGAMGWDTSLNEAIPGNLWQRELSYLTGNIPFAKNILSGRLTAKDRDITRLYPRTAGEDISRSHVLGGFQPTPVNPKRQAEYVAQQAGESRTSQQRINARFNKWIKGVEKAMGSSHNWSPDAKKALQIRYDRATARHQHPSREKRGSLKADVDVAIKHRLIDPKKKKYYYDKLDHATDTEARHFSNYLETLFGTGILAHYRKAAHLKGLPSIG